MKDLMKLLDRPIAFQRPFVDLTGSVTAALFLSQAIYWQRRTTSPDGYFYKTREEWEEETGLTRYEQETAKKKLADIGVLRLKQVGTDRTMRFMVDVDRLDSLLIPIGGNPPDGKAATPPMHGMDSPRTLTETTSEITTETTTPPLKTPSQVSLSKQESPNSENGHTPIPESPNPKGKALRAESIGEPDPEWADLWAEWLDDRKKRRLPNTALALNKQLELLRRDPNPRDVLETAMRCTWKGLFPSKKSAPIQENEIPIAERHAARLKRWGLSQ